MIKKIIKEDHKIFTDEVEKIYDDIVKQSGDGNKDFIIGGLKMKIQMLLEKINKLENKQ